LRALGIAVEEDADGARFVVDGLGGRFPATAADLDVGASGTAARFLTAALTLGRGRYTLDGVPRMRERPIQPLLDALQQLGADARSLRENGCPPVVVQAAGLAGGTCAVRGDISSQYLSALLMVGPCAAGGLTVGVEGELVSRPFVDLTMAVMRDFGAAVREEQGRFLVPPGRYAARDYAIEPDATAASYFFAAAALTGGRVRVEGLGRDSVQGDLAFVDVLERMGCAVARGERSVTVSGPSRLAGIDVDLGAISDTAQTLAALAPFAAGPVTLRNLAHTRQQETDRLAAVAAELRRLGGRVDERPDGLTIYPSTLRGGTVQTYGDHRMAMSFALLGLRVPGIRIADPGCVSKTFPDFFDRFAALYPRDHADGGVAGG
jgi:3-phosphoshikimate 1-carboxyvinyltransferase